MKKNILVLAVALTFLTGCASRLLERTYSTVEPHSSKLWESEAAGTLRAENYQDIVNDLLLLIGQHREAATLRLYNFSDDVAVTAALEQATIETQRETPMGAYAVSYMTSSCQAQRGYYEAQIQIGYRRSAEQIQGIVNATTTEALYRLLADVLDKGKQELVVRISYWKQDDISKVTAVMKQIRKDRNLEETPTWTVNYYPSETSVGLVEFLLDGSQEEEAQPTAGTPDTEIPSGAESHASPSTVMEFSQNLRE